MSDSVWYYVDRSRQRHGPVTAAAVAEAFRAGETDDSSLVWREGMAEWLPLAHFRDELGLAGEVGAPALAAPVHATPATPTTPAYPAPAAGPAAPPKSGKGCLIAAVVGGLVLLFFVAILAAIALPAYQDYVKRAKDLAEAAEAEASGSTDPATDPATDADLSGSGSPDAAILAMALAEARQHQGLVDDFVANTDRCPRDSTEVAVPPVASPGVVAITVGEARTGMCTIEVEFGGEGAQSLAGETLTLSRDIAGDWYCTSALADRDALPQECR